MNKIEKYISLCNKIKPMFDKQEFDKALLLVNEMDEIIASYKVEDLVSDFESIGYKVYIDDVTKMLLEIKKNDKENGIEFDDKEIGRWLLIKYAKEYESRMDTPYAKERKARRGK